MVLAFFPLFDRRTSQKIWMEKPEEKAEWSEKRERFFTPFYLFCR
jgi:hypothetical protein